MSGIWSRSSNQGGKKYFFFPIYNIVKEKFLKYLQEQDIGYKEFESFTGKTYFLINAQFKEMILHYCKYLHGVVMDLGTIDRDSNRPLYIHDVYFGHLYSTTKDVYFFKDCDTGIKYKLLKMEKLNEKENT